MVDLLQMVAQLCGSRLVFSWLLRSIWRPSKMDYAVAMLPHPKMTAKEGEGEDAFFTEGSWIGVSDGVGGWATAGIDAGAYAREFMSHCRELVIKRKAAYGNNGKPMPKKVLVKAATSTKARGSATALIAALHDQTLHVANLGDSGFIVIRDWQVISKSTAMQHDFNRPFQIGNAGDDPQAAETYSVRVSKGDILVVATDGLFDNLFSEDIVASLKTTLGQGSSLQEAADCLAQRAQVAGCSPSTRCPFSEAAKALKLPFEGGKPDDITALVAVVQKQEYFGAVLC